VPDGEVLAKRTLNERLGIIGGLSILGTTGIVTPLSSEAWTATIASSLDVAKAMGRSEIVLSAGRASEKAHIKRYGLPEESYVMMGDYLEFSLREAAQRGFPRIYLCAQWAKMLKIAMATPQTHVRHGAIDIDKTISFLNELGAKIGADAEFNTAREIFDYMLSDQAASEQTQKRVCNAAKYYAAHIADPADIITFLVNYDGEIIASSA
jgi:cobalt-precorrin-5B (C1)-methyltransferase